MNEKGKGANEAVKVLDAERSGKMTLEVDGCSRVTKEFL